MEMRLLDMSDKLSANGIYANLRAGGTVRD